MTTTTEDTPLDHQLARFFETLETYRSPVATRSSALAAELEMFFADWQACRPAIEPAKAARAGVDCHELERWFQGLEQPLHEARRGAVHFNPWQVAGLGNNEVSHSAVLAWLLNPRGSHGLGEAALQPVLQFMNATLDGGFPVFPGRYCRVRTEINPDGQASNRVDIEIDSESFYLLIEVKINAGEGEQQLERYGALAALQTEDRPWAMIFLTRQGGPAQTAGRYHEKVVALSWRNLARRIEHSLVPLLNASPAAAKSPQQHMAEQSVYHYLKLIYSF